MKPSWIFAIRYLLPLSFSKTNPRPSVRQMYYSTAEVAVLTGTFLSDRAHQPKHGIRHARFNFFHRDLARGVVHVSGKGCYTIFSEHRFWGEVHTSRIEKPRNHWILQ